MIGKLNINLRYSDIFKEVQMSSDGGRPRPRSLEQNWNIYPTVGNVGLPTIVAVTLYNHLLHVVFVNYRHKQVFVFRPLMDGLDVVIGVVKKTTECDGVLRKDLDTSHRAVAYLGFCEGSKCRPNFIPNTG